MRIRTSKFREQMETIRELGLAVIPMSDFIAWKNGVAAEFHVSKLSRLARLVNPAV